MIYNKQRTPEHQNTRIREENSSIRESLTFVSKLTRGAVMAGILLTGSNLQANNDDNVINMHQWNQANHAEQQKNQQITNKARVIDQAYRGLSVDTMNLQLHANAQPHEQAIRATFKNNTTLIGYLNEMQGRLVSDIENEYNRYPNLFNDANAKGLNDFISRKKQSLMNGYRDYILAEMKANVNTVLNRANLNVVKFGLGPIAAGLSLFLEAEPVQAETVFRESLNSFVQLSEQGNIVLSYQKANVENIPVILNLQLLQSAISTYNLAIKNNTPVQHVITDVRIIQMLDRYGYAFGASQRN